MNLRTEIRPITTLTPHILRHEYATSLYRAGVDIKTAQILLGHSDIRLTMDLYNHIEAESKEVAEKLDKYHECGQNAVRLKNCISKKKNSRYLAFSYDFGSFLWWVIGGSNPGHPD